MHQASKTASFGGDLTNYGVRSNTWELDKFLVLARLFSVLSYARYNLSRLTTGLLWYVREVRHGNFVAGSGLASAPLPPG
jgi:hypothetical protein